MAQAAARDTKKTPLDRAPLQKPPVDRAPLEKMPPEKTPLAKAPPGKTPLMDSYTEPQRAMQRPVEQTVIPVKTKPLPKDKVYAEQSLAGTYGEPLMLNLFVADQNTAIGRRNIHLVKPGNTYTIGGGKSDFLIFLVPIPPNIASVQVSSDGNNCTFIPLKPKYFPDTGAEKIPFCIGKTIRVISDKNYELRIRIERYQDPLKSLNRMLNSVSVPGEAKRLI